jgi:CDP-glucose 4,6-dehydratase
MLQEMGAIVHGLALPPPTEPSLFHLLGLEGACKHRLGDIRDLETVEAAFRQADPEVVLHLAAQPLVRASYEAPVETYATNVMGTVHVLDAARRHKGVKSIVIVTTDKCYQNDGWIWGYRESDRLGGADPYSNSKAASELVVDAYRQSFFPIQRYDAHGVGLASARAGNVIGGGDFAIDRLVPDAMKAFAAGEPLMIRNPLSVRPWQHVLEPLQGYLLLAERLHCDPHLGEGWNFGPRTDESAPVRDVADRLAADWGEGASWRQDPAEHPHEAATLKLDSTKARLELGWRADLGLDEALRSTVEWYKAFYRNDDFGAITRRQVQACIASQG